jgi:hypothetical protein
MTVRLDDWIGEAVLRRSTSPSNSTTRGCGCLVQLGKNETNIEWVSVCCWRRPVPSPGRCRTPGRDQDPLLHVDLLAVVHVNCSADGRIVPVPPDEHVSRPDLGPITSLGRLAGQGAARP